MYIGIVMSMMSLYYTKATKSQGASLYNYINNIQYKYSKVKLTGAQQAIKVTSRQINAVVPTAIIITFVLYLVDKKPNITPIKIV